MRIEEKVGVAFQREYRQLYSVPEHYIPNAAMAERLHVMDYPTNAPQL